MPTKVLYNVLSYKPETESEALQFGLSLLGKKGVNLAHHAQLGLVMAFAEKALRGFDEANFHALGREMNDIMPSVDLGECDAGKEVGVHGWFPQALVDLVAVQVCSSSVTVTAGDTVGRDLRVKIVGFMDNYSKVSSRIKVLFKHMNGTHIQWGKMAYEVMSRVSLEQKELNSIDDTYIEVVEGFADGLAKIMKEADGCMDKDKVRDLWNAVVEMMETNEADLKKFGLALRMGGKNDSSEVVRGNEVRRQLVAALLKTVSLIAEAWLSEDSLSRKLYLSEFMTEELPTFEKMLAGLGEGSDFEDVMNMEWLSSAMSLLQDLIDDAQEEQQIWAAAKDRVNLNIMVYSAWTCWAQNKDTNTMVVHWSGVWQAYQRVDGITYGTVPAGYESVDKLVVSMRTMQKVDETILRFVIETLGRTGTDKMVRELQPKLGSLPPSVEGVVEAATLLTRLEDAASRCRSGKDTGGLLELAVLFSSMHKVVAPSRDVFALRENYKGNQELVFTEFEELLTTHLKKVNGVEALSEFLEKFKGLDSAIEDWKFDGVPWLTEKDNAEVDALGKKVQQVVTQYSVWVSVTGRLEKLMDWASSKNQASVRDACKQLNDVGSKVDSATLTLAYMVLGSIIVTEEKAGRTANFDDDTNNKAALKFVTGVLKVPLAKLPKKLVGKLGSGTAGGTSLPPAEGGAAATAVPAKKKLRKQ